MTLRAIPYLVVLSDLPDQVTKSLVNIYPLLCRSLYEAAAKVFRQVLALCAEDDSTSVLRTLETMLRTMCTDLTLIV